MAFPSNIPAPISTAIQTGLLDRTFRQSLTAETSFGDTADSMEFPGGIGSTLTFTKMGLLPPSTTPIASRTNTDITDGLTTTSYPLEQYLIGVDPYVQTMNLQLASAAQAIDSLFLQNAYALGESARRSMDTLCYQALMNGYMAYNTHVTATASGVLTVSVNDVRGFFENISASTGKVVPTSVGNPLNVVIAGNTFICTAAVADGTAPAALPTQLANLTFSGSSSNSSTVANLGGFSGKLTLTTNVTAAIGDTAVSVTAPQMFRPNGRANDTKLVSGDVLSMAVIRQAMNRMRANGVRGQLTMFIDDIAYGALQADTEFRQYLQTRDGSQSFREGTYGRILGVDFVRTNVMQFDSTTVSGQVISRPIIVSQGALMQAKFTAKAYANALQDDLALISMADNVAHVTQPPINTMADVIRQTWVSYTGFTCPSDAGANSSVFPSANNAMRKRAAVISVTQS